MEKLPKIIDKKSQRLIKHWWLHLLVTRGNEENQVTHSLNLMHPVTVSANLLQLGWPRFLTKKQRIIWWLRNFVEDLLDRFLHSWVRGGNWFRHQRCRDVAWKLFCSQSLENTNSRNPLELIAKLLWILHEAPSVAFLSKNWGPNQCLTSLHGAAGTNFVLNGQHTLQPHAKSVTRVNSVKTVLNNNSER